MASPQDDKTMDVNCPFDGELPVTRPPTPVVRSNTEIEWIANAPMESLSFKDFKGLKSGRDEFSRMSSEQLADTIAWVDKCSLTLEFQGDFQAEASCIRWMLRGLPMSKAIRKVRTDAEVAANAIAGRRRR
jgi:hypothetical protein